MSSSLSIVIIDQDRESRSLIDSHIRPYADKIRVLGSVGDFQEGLRFIQTTTPIVVILAVNDLEHGILDIKSIANISPRTSVFVTTSEKNPDWILKLMRAGAQEYLLKPIESNEFLEALQKAGRLHIERTAHLEPAVEGKVISVYNPNGGMGTTTIAVNLAAALANKSDKVALVDLNFFSGDTSTFLDINPKYTLSSLTSNVSRLDASFLMSVMSRHSSGIYLLSEPLNVDETVDITPEQIRRVMAYLRHIFSYIIVDTGGQLHGTNQLTFEGSNFVIFNTILTLPTLKNATRYLDAMEKHGIDKAKIKLVVNRYLARSDIKVEDAEKVLNHKAFLTIPNEYADVINSINKGEPLVTLYPRSPVSRAIISMAETFL